MLKTSGITVFTKQKNIETLCSFSLAMRKNMKHVYKNKKKSHEKNNEICSQKPEKKTHKIQISQIQTM